MPGVPFLHLGTLRPAAVSLVSLLAPNSEPGPPVDPSPTPSTPEKRAGILKKMAIPITWGPSGGHSYPTPKSTPNNKLRKKSVHFTPPPTASSADTVETPMTPPPVVSDLGLPTPEPTPEKKKGVFGKMFTKSNKTVHPVVLPTMEHADPGESWNHHASYFPEYEPIYTDPLIVPGVPGVRTHERYFPSYTPLLTKDGLGPHSSAYAYALDPAVAQAQAHAQAVGHNVVVHYPELPKSADYNGGKDAKSGWTSAQWGVEGWTGYGWQGDGTKLPDKDGNTFGAPMPKGQELPKQQGGAGGGGGGGGGGSSKNKKKKNKKSGHGDDTHIGGGDKADGDEGGGDGDGGGDDE